MPEQKAKTRIQQRNSAAILDAALDAFSTHGFRGARLEQIASAAGMSKPNLLYYFPSKKQIYANLLTGLLDTWLDPLRALDPAGDPVEEIVAYVMRKLEMSRRFPRESRLFANEILQGAPVIEAEIRGGLRALVEEKSALLEGWMKAGRLAPMDPRHLIFSIWATTQHYADFDAQLRGILSPEKDAHFQQAETFLSQFYRNALRPPAGGD
jgi:TetR/AcrR family transcriptional regulator